MGALQKIQVVDFGHYVAGPVTGMLLADQGAEVIKIDPPGGPRFNSEANATWNRGKRSLTLDLHDPEDLEVAKSLAARADVVIENFRPGVMDRLGLGEAELRALNRGLIYAAIPGFGPEDARANVPAWEGVVLAATDTFRPAVAYRDMIQQLHQKPEHRAGEPTYTAEPVASMFAAMLTAVGISAALNVRGLTGRGQRVQVPLFDAMIQASGVHAMARLPFKPTYGSAVSPWNHQYQCGDGRWIHVACDQPHQVLTLIDLIERPDLGPTEAGEWRPGQDHAIITPTLAEVFRSRTAEAWEALFMEHGLPGAMCRSSAEWLQDPIAVEGRFLVGVDSPTLGPTVQPAPIVRLNSHQLDSPGPAPFPDEHRAELLAEADLPLPQLDRSTTPISPVLGPLRGFRVLDLGTGLAGPVCGRTLAELGAEVIKIDDPTSGSIPHHHDTNRGKRSMLLEFESDDDYEQLLDLVATADVVIESFPPGDAEDLGLDYETLKQENPRLIYASVSPYGNRGPLADMPGTGETASALTGIQVRYGGPDQPTTWPYPGVTEYGTGYAAAFGVIMGLLDRRTTDEGTRIHAAMATTAGLLQSAHLIDHRSKQWTEPSGPDQVGASPFQSLYRCEDGWIFLGAENPSQLEPLLGEIDDIGPGLRRALADWCELRSAADAVEHLVKQGMGAHELTWLNHTMSDPVVVRRGLSLIRDHGENTGLLRTTGPAQWLSRSMITEGAPTPSLGADTDEILARLRSRHLQQEEPELETDSEATGDGDADSGTEADAENQPEPDGDREDEGDGEGDFDGEALVEADADVDDRLADEVADNFDDEVEDRLTDEAADRFDDEADIGSPTDLATEEAAEILDEDNVPQDANTDAELDLEIGDAVEQVELGDLDDTLQDIEPVEQPVVTESGSVSGDPPQVFEPVDLAQRGEGKERDPDHNQGADTA